MNGTAIMDEEVVATPPEVIEDIERYKQEVARLEEQAKKLTVDDDLSEEVALEFINGAKRLYGDMEDKRDKRVRPLNTTVKKINEAYKPYTSVLDRLWRVTDQARSNYLTKKQAAIDAANRKAIADANEIRRKKEAQEEAARVEAKRLRDEQERLEKEENDRLLQAEMDKLAAEQKIKDEQEALERAKREGDARAAREAQESIDRAKREEDERARKAENDRLAAVAEQQELERKAIKQDAKADIAATQATMVAPTIEVNDSRGSRMLESGEKVGTRQVEDWRFENGTPIYVDPLTRKKYEEYYADDPRLKGVEIPQNCVLVDLAKLGKIVKAGVLVKGCTRFMRNATTAGGK